MSTVSTFSLIFEIGKKFLNGFFFYCSFKTGEKVCVNVILFDFHVKPMISLTNP